MHVTASNLHITALKFIGIALEFRTTIYKHAPSCTVRVRRTVYLEYQSSLQGGVFFVIAFVIAFCDSSLNETRVLGIFVINPK